MKASGTPSSFNATTKQFADAVGIDYMDASNLTRLLVKLGVVTDTGEVVNNPSGKGKGSKVYTYPQQVTLNMTADGTSK
jgi:hypothetical protein